MSHQSKSAYERREQRDLQNQMEDEAQLEKKQMAPMSPGVYLLTKESRFTLPSNDGASLIYPAGSHFERVSNSKGYRPIDLAQDATELYRGFIPINKTLLIPDPVGETFTLNHSTQFEIHQSEDRGEYSYSVIRFPAGARFVSVDTEHYRPLSRAERATELYEGLVKIPHNMLTMEKKTGSPQKFLGQILELRENASIAAYGKNDPGSIQYNKGARFRRISVTKYEPLDLARNGSVLWPYPLTVPRRLLTLVAQHG